ncbi:uncharacterized protein AB675_4929 [Cyphellophora attinorum]|uniref:Protein DSF2 n=1 Tax=Cyphellophora attinorum TaxID=1664694 RepID=A0A0N0NHI9_9EURO|nr:uncharacterized protein AB675_4929 [Phialophora attinorum]KPI34618.1 hypothetical protein AB675_4929 [Phialophora attinorum]
MATQATEFTFVRTDTHTQDFIQPPDGPDPEPEPAHSPRRKGFSGHFRRKSKSPSSPSSEPPLPPSDSSPSLTSPKEGSGGTTRRLSQRLHLSGKSLRKSRSASTSSTHLPQDLPPIDDDFRDLSNREDTEAKWEDRATRLARKSPSLASAGVPSPAITPVDEMSRLNFGFGEQHQQQPRSPSRPRSVSDAAADVNIQEAIRLHEAGQLEGATEMFHQLADQGNVLSQVLFGLSLRHGWGCKPDPALAVTYLSRAAADAGEVEALALQSGMKKGGAARGELVLAIFELANCFRNGWGVPVDKVAARQYYETAANLGETDAMREAAWCYLEGFGGKKDKFKAAQLLRLAEKNGEKVVGESWIWKEKYDPK